MGSENSQNPPNTGSHESGFTTTATDTTLSEALIVLRKRRWVLIIAVLAGLAYGIFRALSQPKMYEAYGRIQVRSGSSNEYRVQAISGYDTDASSKMLTEVAILQSDTLMQTVARDMDLANNATFLTKKGPVPHVSMDDPDVRQSVVHRVQSNCHITQVPKTDIIRIACDSLDGTLSANIVNKIIDEYIQRSYETRFASTQKVSQWLSNQLDDLRQQVETSQTQMMDIQKRLGVLGFDSTHNQIQTTLDDLAKAAGTAKINRIMAESRYRVLSGMDPDTIGGSIDMTPGVPTGTLGQLRATLATQKALYAQTLKTLAPNHPTAQGIKAQIEELQKQIDAEQNRLLVQAKENFVAAQANENQTQAALESEKSNAYKMRDDLVEYTQLQRQFESNRTLYEGLLQKLRTAGVEAGLESLEIDIVDRAEVPARPQLQPQSTIIMTTVVFAILGGIVVAFLMESLDTGLRSVAEIENITELPSLAIIPRSRRSSAEEAANLSTAQRNVSVLTQPKSQFSEAIRSLRTALLLSQAGHPPKTILFTSATPSEGKTTTASNLAAVLAQGDNRVLLIDGDLRRPNVHHRFGLNGRIGLTTVLTGAMKLDEAVQRVPEIPNLYILPSGPVPPFPTEMLSSDVMDKLLEQCKDLYTHVIIDSPPVLSVTDGVILARDVDAVVLVVRHGKSSKHVVRRARDLLLRSGAEITGIVLNAVDLSSPEYYGYYGYSGYSYSSIDTNSWEATNKKSEAMEESNQ